MKTALLFGFLALTSAVAHAETLCRSEITYQWKKDKEETASTVHVITLEARGADDAAAKAALRPQLDREKARAQAQCRSEHEDMTGCVSAKFLSMNDALQRMGFSERKSIESAISTDCSARQGRCADVTAVEAVCTELVTAAGQSSSSDKNAKKDDKAKKK